MKHSKLFAIVLAAALLLTMFTGCGKKPEADPDANLDYIGSVTDATYSNPYFGISFTAPEGWVYYDDEALLSMMGATTELMDDVTENYDELMEKTGTTHVMMATAPTGENTNVVVQKTQEAMKGIGDDVLYPMLRPTLETQFQQAGLAGVTVNIGTTTFLGESRDAIFTTVDSMGMVQKQIYIIKDTYSCIVTVSAADEATADAIMALYHS